MPSQDVSFTADDVAWLYRHGRPSSWEVLIERAEKSDLRRNTISGPQAHEMAYAIRLLHQRGGNIPHNARDCYDQMVQVLAAMPAP